MCKKLVSVDPSTADRVLRGLEMRMLSPDNDL
jgi:hypothetical protein